MMKEYRRSSDSCTVLWQTSATALMLTNSTTCKEIVTAPIYHSVWRTFFIIFADSLLSLLAGVDLQRIMELSKVIDGEVCFISKEAFNIHNLFHSRYTLHKQMYAHRVVKGIELMIADALDAADNYLQLSDILRVSKRVQHSVTNSPSFFPESEQRLQAIRVADRRVTKRNRAFYCARAYCITRHYWQNSQPTIVQLGGGGSTSERLHRPRKGAQKGSGRAHD